MAKIVKFHNGATRRMRVAFEVETLWDAVDELILLNDDQDDVPLIRDIVRATEAHLRRSGMTLDDVQETLSEYDRPSKRERRKKASR